MSFPERLLRRRRVTPTWNPDDTETEEILRRAESNIIPPRSLQVPTNVDPTTGAIFEQPISRQSALPIARRVIAAVPQVLGNSLPTMQESAIQDAQQRISGQLDTNIQQITGSGGIPMGQDNVIPIRRIRPTFEPAQTSITPEMADQSTLIDRPVYPDNVVEMERPRRLTPVAPELDTSLVRRRVDPMTDLLRKEEDIRLNPEKMSRKKAILLGALQGLAAGGLGGALGGAAVGAISPGSLQRLRQQQELAEVNGEIDNRLTREQRMAQVDYMRQRPGIQQQQIQQRAASQQQAALMRQLSLQGKYKRGENPTLDAQLDEAGLNVSDFDKTRGQNPIFRASNGIQYQYNRQSGQFEEAQGIPQDQGAVRVPYRLSDGTTVNVSQNTAASADAAKQARDIARQDRQEQQTYQRGRDAQSDQRYDTQRRQSATTQLRTLYDLYRRAEQADTVEDAEAIRREADLFASDLEGTYGDIEGVKDAVRKAKEAQQRQQRSGSIADPLYRVMGK